MGHSPIVIVPPPIESLRDLRRDSYWPRRLLEDPVLSATCRARTELSDTLLSVYGQIPDATTPLSTESPRIGASVETLYQQLTELLESDVSTRRLTLYLPLELLPARDATITGISPDVRSRFETAFCRRWLDTLSEYDVRANFVDGNILEPELAPDGQPRVHKGTHLIPPLVTGGIVTESSVRELMRTTDSETLQHDIAEALRTRTDPRDESATKLPFTIASLGNLPEMIAYELRMLDMRAATDASRGAPAARTAWERRNNEELLISRFASALSLHDEENVFGVVSGDSVVTRILIRAQRMMIERIHSTDPVGASVRAHHLIAHVRTLYAHAPSVLDEYETAVAYLRHYGFVTDTETKELGFPIPNLYADFDPKSALAHDLGKFTDVIEILRSDPEYARLFYPVVLFFGSRLKGYAARNADLDAAVFIRPGIELHERPRIRRILSSLFDRGGVGGKVVEFWLRDDASTLHVRDFALDDVYLADCTWAHLLFGSVWLGADDEIHMLYAHLLPGFLKLGTTEYRGVNLRETILAQMERETLQYRLMHKGYRRFFPPSGGIAAHPSLDSESVFWDSGYRRLASVLYARRVLLP